MVLSIIFLLFSVSSSGLLDQINNSYIDSVYDLPEIQGLPEIKWQQKDHIRAWIDIVGFRHMAYINGAYYVPGQPANFTIVQYEVKPKLCSNCQLTSIKKSLSVIDTGNVTTASLSVVLKYDEIIVVCDKSSCWENQIPYTETAVFQDSELSPLIYDADKEHVQIKEVNYNHSLYAEKLIYVNTSNLITRYNVSIDNGSVLHRLQIGEIQYTKKNIPYANYTVFDIWKQSGTGINYLDKAVVTQNINDSYNLQAYSPFGQVNNTNITVSYNTWTPEKAIAHFTFLIIFVLSVAFFGINKMRRT